MQAGSADAGNREIDGASPAPPPIAEGVSFVEILVNLYRQRVMIAAVTALGIVLGLPGAFLSSRTFVAQTKIIPTAYLSSSSDISSASALRGAAAQFGLGMGGPSANISPLFPQLLSSNELIDRLLARKYQLPDGLSIELIPYLKISGDDPERTRRTAIGRIRGALRSVYDIKSGVTTIYASFKDPQLAAAVANAGAEELDAFLKELKTSQAGQKARFIAQRLNDVQVQLQAAEDALKAFRQQNRQVIGSPLLMLEEARLARAVSMNEQMFITLKTQYETARIEAIRDVPDIAIIEKAVGGSPQSNRRRILIVATLVFGLAGVVIALSRPHLDDFKRALKLEERRSAPAA